MLTTDMNFHRQASNLEAAAERYARKMQRRYIEKRGGSVPVKVAQNVYDWAFRRFMEAPELTA